MTRFLVAVPQTGAGDVTTATSPPGTRTDGYEVAENHGVGIVGWDDAYPARASRAARRTPPGDGAFLVRNSWGADLGDSGYFWVSYYDRSFARDELHLLHARRPGRRLPPHLPVRQAWLDFGLGLRPEPQCWGANRFKARGDGRIAAVSFYTRVAGTRYQVYAGAHLKDSSFVARAPAPCRATRPSLSRRPSP